MSEKTATATAPSRKKEKRIVNHALVFINATFNNTLISITDLNGDVLMWAATGMHGFKGSRKSTPYAGKVVSTELMKNAVTAGVKTVDIKISGPGSGREPALRAISASGVKINSIKDVTPIPHNGCRPPKRRRL